MDSREQKFEGLAGNYDAHRANYPAELLAAFREACPMPEDGGIVVDVGSGTGISTRQLRDLFMPHVAVIGIEPGDDMRRTAVANSAHLPNLAYLNFPAENLPFRRSAVDAVFVAQALHWFDRPQFYAEAARVLRLGGSLGLIENNRDWRASPFLAAYETLLETYGDDYQRDYRRFDLEAELLPVRELVFERQLSASHVMTMAPSSFVAWSFTSTKMQDCIRNRGEKRIRGALAVLMERYFGRETAVEIPYSSVLIIAARV